MRPKGTAAELERRRKRAVEAVRLEGLSPATVARAFGVHRVTVRKWLQAANVPHGLDAKPASRNPALADDRLPELEGLLRQGARAHGWPNDVWSADRVAEVIRRHFGVAYHVEHVRKIIRRRLDWSSQKPQRKAKQRDDEAIAH